MDCLSYIAILFMVPLVEVCDVIFFLIVVGIILAIMPMCFLIIIISTITALIATIVDFCNFGINSLCCYVIVVTVCAFFYFVIIIVCVFTLYPTKISKVVYIYIIFMDTT